MRHEAVGLDAGRQLSLGSRGWAVDGVRSASRLFELRSQLQEFRAVAGIQNNGNGEQRRVRTLATGDRRLRSADLETATGGLQHGCNRGYGKDHARLHVQGE